jgi:hypothetical protein
LDVPTIVRSLVFCPIRGGDMTTVHIENIVQDFDTWKVNFG